VGEERRRTPRFPFIATAEVIDQSTKASVNTRVSELSLYGCYVDMASPPPEGTVIYVKIYSEGKHFESAGKVVYSVPNQGFGVCFQEVRHQFLIVLKEWLILAAQARFGKQPEPR
jgi:PilZ domain